MDGEGGHLKAWMPMCPVPCRNPKVEFSFVALEHRSNDAKYPILKFFDFVNKLNFFLRFYKNNWKVM
ncbi:hypothetical protein [Thermoanaerobacter sp. A7A]|uniref:hypothetical protein n=1 Tax=Thermoanaerobacter sp. A7A TaxID=1350366 RepID=UPI0004A4B042|nr:hypothetical protein [Thermoanaerobacter sp. A7A]